jgi:hypothetical protein
MVGVVSNRTVIALGVLRRISDQLVDDKAERNSEPGGNINLRTLDYNRAPPSAPTVIVAIVQLPWKADAKRGRLCALNSVRLSAIAAGTGRMRSRLTGFRRDDP